MKGFIVGAGHEAQVFKNRLDRMEENICRCGQTPSEVGEEFVSSEDEGRMELSYASAVGEEYMAPRVENSIPLPVPAPTSCCLGATTTLPPMEEISKEPTFICEDLDGLLREADEGRARDLQEGSSQSVVRPPPRLGSERWRRLNGIHCMRPGPGRREQRATRSCSYIQRDSSRCSGCQKLDLWHLCFSLNFYFLMFLLQCPSMFPLLTYSQSFLFPYLLTTRDTQDEGEARLNSTNTGKQSKYHFTT